MKAPPPEVPADRSTGPLAPVFRDRVNAVLNQLGSAKIAEGMRTAERQAFLYGFGREYDDGRGIVTRAPTNLTSWHGFGMAVDIVHATLEWDASRAWFRVLGETAKAHECAWGGDWTHPDLPHVQPAECPASPTDEDRQLLADEGPEAVWAKYGLDAGSV